MCRDRLILAGLAGLAGAAVDALIHWACVLAGLIEAAATNAHYMAAIIFAGEKAATGRIVLGQLAHLISGGVLGATVLFLLSRSGRQWAPVKGAAMGAGYWLNHVVLIPGFVAARVMIRQTPAGVIVDLVALVAWGAVTAAVLARMLDRLPDCPAGDGSAR